VQAALASGAREPSSAMEIARTKANIVTIDEGLGGIGAETSLRKLKLVETLISVFWETAFK
jgi:hypothetical protein